jgi:uncharacterized radical SAM protein YgiQ
MAKSLRVLPKSPAFIPMTRDECVERGWLPADDQAFDDARHGVDFVFVTGDAYVDHPSFANAVIPRLLEREGFRVAILAQPRFVDASEFSRFGRPRLAWLVSSGNLDAMLNNYTAHKKPRSDDTYAPGGRGGLRPDYASVVYAQRCREAQKGVPVIVGGVEASMRRLAHYDYWSDKVRRSLVLDARADLLVYGMGETPLLEIVGRLQKGEPISSIKDVAGTCYYVGKKTLPHFITGVDDNETPWFSRPLPKGVLELPAFDDIKGDDPVSKERFARAQHLFHREQNPQSSPILFQRHGELTVVVNPPQSPMSTEELDRVFALPFNRVPHPVYGDETIPAYDMVKFSVNVMRGCFGGCTFCAITEHQGKKIQSRSEASVLAEVQEIKKTPGFTGVLSDLGGPTANMYRMTCSDPKAESVCRRPSCVHPSICKKLTTDHTPIKDLMKKVRETNGVKKVLVASGVRMDLANLDQGYIDELAAHHVGGHLKVAPEHVDADTLYLMKKPGVDVYLDFEKRFADASLRAGKEQYLVPYFVSSHPGCDLDGAIELGQFLRERNQRVRQAQDFIPTPGTPATCMWWTGIEPVSMQPVFVEHKMREKRKQKALMQHWMPENAPLVREALRDARRTDLIGTHRGALVSAYDTVSSDGPAPGQLPKRDDRRGRDRRR